MSLILESLAFGCMFAAACVAMTYLAARAIGLRKIGGLYHWRIGRVGGSFYRASVRSMAARRVAAAKARQETWEAQNGIE